MTIVVFDADVLIAYLTRDDLHHASAVERMRQAVGSRIRRLVSAVNYGEVLIGPLTAAGPAGASVVDSMFVRLGIDTVPVHAEMARLAAGVRARTKLKLPDAYAVATAIHVGGRGLDDVRLESFDLQVVKAYEDLRPRSQA